MTRRYNKKIKCWQIFNNIKTFITVTNSCNVTRKGKCCRHNKLLLQKGNIFIHELAVEVQERSHADRCIGNKWETIIRFDFHPLWVQNKAMFDFPGQKFINFFQGV